MKENEKGAREYSRAAHRKSARRRGSLWAGLVVFLLLVAVGGGAAWKWQSDRDYKRKWGDIVMPERVARVLAPTNATSLGKLLQRTGKVRDADAFSEAAQEIGLREIPAGGYLLPQKAGPRVLAKAFAKGPTLQKITFPEGFTAGKMASRLARAGFSGAQEFRAKAYPANGKTLEGTLFPDTYYLPLRGRAADLVRPMQDRFREVMKGIPRASFPVGAGGKRLSEREVVILASLVERETSVPSERALVAGVLLRRLRIGMRLQCDASVQYARERALASGRLPQGHKERLFFRDLKIDSPYNTYQNAGLPPGPICNPGKEALRAAAAPRNTDKLFYVLSPKLDRHLFAKTFAEHNRNIRLVQAERKP